MLTLSVRGKTVVLPEKIFCIDPEYKHLLYKIITLYIDEPWIDCNEKVFKIVEFRNEWFWIEEAALLKYIDYEKIKHLKAFL